MQVPKYFLVRTHHENGELIGFVGAKVMQQQCTFLLAPVNEAVNFPIAVACDIAQDGVTRTLDHPFHYTIRV